eukprot:scaffold96261_cov34-Tisochrysis_lutea.AAC.5
MNAPAAHYACSAASTPLRWRALQSSAPHRTARRTPVRSSRAAAHLPDRASCPCPMPQRVMRNDSNRYRRRAQGKS